MKSAAALVALAVLAGCGSLAMQDDAASRVEAALKAYAQVEGKEMSGVSLQIVGPSALQTGTFRQKTRLADGSLVESKGTFEAEWERQADGSWRLGRMTMNPPPFEVPPGDPP